LVEQVFDFQKQKGNYLNVRLISPPSRRKSLIVIIKSSTENHFWEYKCACLSNYRHLPRKNFNKLGVSSENEPFRIHTVNI